MGKSNKGPGRSKARSKSRSKKTARGRSTRASRSFGRRGSKRAQKTREVISSTTATEEPSQGSRVEVPQQRNEPSYFRLFQRALAEFIDHQPQYNPNTPTEIPGFVRVGDPPIENIGQENIIGVHSDFEHIFHYSGVEGPGQNAPFNAPPKVNKP